MELHGDAKIVKRQRAERAVDAVVSRRRDEAGRRLIEFSSQMTPGISWYDTISTDGVTILLPVERNQAALYHITPMISGNLGNILNTDIIVWPSHRPHYAPCPSVCPSVCPVRARYSKTKKRRKIKIGIDVSHCTSK